MPSTSTSHYALTKKQLAILDLLYRFRFGTSELLANHTNTNKNTMNKRLQLMMELEYIGRKFEPEYRLLRKHASYYLLPAGAKVLKQSDAKYSSTVLRNTSKDKIASDQFAQHCLDVFSAYSQLSTVYGDSIKFFSKSELAKYSYFPKPLPNAYMRLDIRGTSRQYFIEIIHASKPWFTVIKRIKQYIGYAEDGEWENTKTPLPAILLICDTPTLQKRIQKVMPIIAEDEDMDDLKFYTTTTDKLISTQSKNDRIWLNAVEYEGEFSLGHEQSPEAA